MIEPRNKNAGFATVVAMVSLMLIGVTIAGLMTRVSMESRRTSAEIARAQQEQIAIAKLLDPAAKLPPELPGH